MLRHMAKITGFSMARARGMRSAWASALVVAPVLWAGCAYGELKQVLRAQVASELHCSAVTIEDSPLYQPGYNAGQYLVKGCGIDRTYNCPTKEGLISYGAKPCTYLDSKAMKPPEPAPIEDDPMLDDPGHSEPPDPEPPLAH
jgi:hypothetical protein